MTGPDTNEEITGDERQVSELVVKTGWMFLSAPVEDSHHRRHVPSIIHKRAVMELQKG